MLKHGFKKSHVDNYLYTKKDEDGNPIIVVVYVDDMLLVGKKKSTLARTLLTGTTLAWFAPLLEKKVSYFG